jgi:CheY-like chemotaxis protein
MGATAKASVFVERMRLAPQVYKSACNSDEFLKKTRALQQTSAGDDGASPMMLESNATLYYSAAWHLSMATVLVIDDDAEMRQVLRRTLEGAGYTVTEAANGKAGVEIYRSSPTQLVISDIVMPEQSGIETICQLKSEFPAVRIIGISGGGMAAHLRFLRTAGDFGADAWLAKPFAPGELLTLAEGVLSIPYCPPSGG